MARRPHEREGVCLDGGRRTTQLMRDSLGGTQGLPSVAPLRGSLQRLRQYLEVALQDHVGTDAFDRLIGHVDALQVDLARFGARQHESTRAHAGAVAAEMEASERAGILVLDGDLAREANVLRPLLAAYLETPTIGGAA